MQSACQGALTAHQAMPHVGASQFTEQAEVHTEYDVLYSSFLWINVNIYDGESSDLLEDHII